MSTISTPTLKLVLNLNKEMKGNMKEEDDFLMVLILIGNICLGREQTPGGALGSIDYV